MTKPMSEGLRPALSRAIRAAAAAVSAVPVETGFMGCARIPVLRLTDIVQRQNRPPFAYPHPFEDPCLIGPDLQLLKETVRNDIFRMEMTDAVQIEH